MKLLHVLCVASLLWLTGCASTNTVSTLDPITGLPTSGTLQRAGASAGGLQPITAAQANSRAVAQLQVTADLWERIRRGFAMPNLDNDLVHEREQYYANRPDYMLRMSERSRKYMFHIVEELERRNMPTELALLPFVESAFNPQAVSGAKAAGIWQFMPATGRTFELKQNVFRDDRRDVLASTRAALDYLQKLHDMFGDWQLALAAYNWGEGNVARAIAYNQRAGLGTSYQDLNMPMETRLYVPKLQAVKNIVANPQSFNTTLPVIGNHPYFQSVNITRDIDVTLAAKLAEVTVEDFKALNPSARRPVILAAGTPQILLPWDNAAIFKRNLQINSATQLASWTAWTVPSTMKASDAARRAGMDVSEFRDVNQIPPKMLIKVGSTLLVPRSERVEDDVTAHVADNGQLALAPEPPPITLHRTLVKARRGESVASLAKRYGQSATSVAEWNRMNASAALKAGQHMVVYLPVLPVKARPAGTLMARAATRHGGKLEARTMVARAAPHRGAAPRGTLVANNKGRKKKLVAAL